MAEHKSSKYKWFNIIIESIVILGLLFIGWTVVDYLGKSLEKPSPITTEISLDIGSVEGKNAENIAKELAPILKEKINKVSNEIINETKAKNENSAIERIYYVVVVTSMFFTVLVLILTIFQYLKSKQYEEKMGKMEDILREKIDEISAFDDKIKNYKEDIKLSRKVSFHFTKGMNYLNNSEGNRACIYEFEKILELSQGREDILDLLDKKQVYYNLYVSYKNIEHYDKAVYYIEKVINVENIEYSSEYYLRLYLEFCELHHLRVVKIQDVDEYKEVLKLYKKLLFGNRRLNLSDAEIDFKVIKPIAILNKKIGVMLFDKNDRNQAREYLEGRVEWMIDFGVEDEDVNLKLHRIYLEEGIKDEQKFIKNYNSILDNNINKMYFNEYICSEIKIEVDNILNVVIKYYEKKVGEWDKDSKEYKQILRIIYIILRENNSYEYKNEEIKNEISELYKADKRTEEDPWEKVYNH